MCGILLLNLKELVSEQQIGAAMIGGLFVLFVHSFKSIAILPEILFLQCWHLLWIAASRLLMINE